MSGMKFQKLFPGKLVKVMFGLFRRHLPRNYAKRNNSTCPLKKTHWFKIDNSCFLLVTSLSTCKRKLGVKIFVV